MDKDVLNEVWVVDQVNLLIENAEVGDRAEPASRLEQKRKRLPQEGEHVEAAWTGWKLHLQYFRALFSVAARTFHAARIANAKMQINVPHRA